MDSFTPFRCVMINSDIYPNFVISSTAKYYVLTPETSDIDKREKILQRINRLLPVESMIKFPAFITNDYINRTLDLLEERLETIEFRTRKQESLTLGNLK
jgi:hypothetical protein